MTAIYAGVFSSLLVAIFIIGIVQVNKSYPNPIKAMEPFNPESPGLGLDLYQRKVEEHAMAYALYASSASMLGMKKQTKIAADWLINNPSSENHAGWGLPFAWDAFGDKSINPISTVYGVTVALGVRALFDTYDLTKEVIYKETAIEALEYYILFFHDSENGGFFGYSDQPTDQIDTYNISSILMGQYARAYHYTRDNKFREIAKKSKQNLDFGRRTIDTETYWPYSVYEDRPNDLVHAAYIVQGYVDYAKYVDKNLDIRKEVNYLMRFFDKEMVKEFPDHSKFPAQTAKRAAELLARPARGWGVGMLIYTLADYGYTSEAIRAARALKPYEAGNDIYATTPGREEFIPRIQSHVTFGLAKLEMANKFSCYITFISCLRLLN